MHLRIKICLVLFLFFPFLGFSQGEWNNWYFGAWAAMTFVNGTPVALPPSPMVISAGNMSASVSDSAGNLRFYSNGYRIWSYNHNWMTNGNGLLGGVNYTRQPVFAVPVIGNKDQYYHFTVGRSESSGPLTGLHYSIIDMTLDGGYGAIIPGYKNIPIPTGDSAVNHLTAIRHQNNRDVWVVVFRHGHIRQYLAYLINASGINDPVISNSSLPPVFYQKGSIRISQDGQNLVCSDSIAEVCYFNPATGAVTRRFTFLPWNMGLPAEADDMEFSVDSRYLYTMKLGGNVTTNTPLWQFDLEQPDSAGFMQSGDLIGTKSAGSIQMGPDGRIYVGNPTSPIDSLNRINNPSSPGASCNYEQNAVYLGGSNCNESLPQFLQTYKAYIHDSIYCAANTTWFWGDIWPPADTIRWNFGDPASGAANVSALATPSHLYSTPGFYTVELYVRHNDNRTDTTWRTITIFPGPQPVLGPDQAIQQGNTVTFDAGFCSGCTYQWSNLTQGNPNIGTGQTYTTGEAGVYVVSVTNEHGCVGKDTVQLTIIPANPVTPAGFEYWFAAPEVTHEFVPPSPYTDQNLNQPIKLVFTTVEGPSSVTITQPANASFIPISVTVQNEFVTEVDLTPFLEQVETKPANTILGTGIKIIASGRVHVTYEIQNGVNSETFTLKGKNALGYEFIVPSQDVFPNHEFCSPPARNSFTIVATEDSTSVEIIPAADIEGHLANDTVVVLLNRGQTWCARAINGDSLSHLGGSFVFANYPIAITVKDDALDPITFNFTENSIDLTGDQLIPRHLAGKKYFTDNKAYQPGGDVWLYVYAYEDHTEVSLAGNIIGTLNRGGFIRQRIRADTVGCLVSFLLEATKPVCAFELMLSAAEIASQGKSWGQTAALVLAPVECAGSKSVTCADTPPYCPPPPPIQVSDAFNATVITKLWNIQNITGQQGGSPVWIPQYWCPVPGTNGEWVTSSVQFSGTTSPVIFNSSAGKFHLMTQHFFASAYNRLSFVSNFASLNLGPDKQTCPGESIMLDAGNEWDTYLWNSGETTATLTVSSPGAYWVQVSGDSCQLSDTIVISHYWSQPISLGSDQQICTDDSIHLDAGPGRSWYQWSTGDTTQAIWAKADGTYWVKAPDVHCVVSDTVQISTTPPPVIMNFSLNDTICSGEPTNIQLTSNVSGTMFHWTASLTSGNITGFSADSGLVINQTLINSEATAGTVTYSVIPKIGDCSGTAAEFTVTVNPNLLVSVSVTASENPVCEGTAVTFTAAAIHGGSTPAFQWKINAVNANNATNAVFTYIPVNGDQVSVLCTSSILLCTSNNPATSDPITMTVNPPSPVSVSVSATENPVCEGTAVTFAAAAIYGGSTPAYQWKINAVNANNATNAVFTYIPANGDQVSVLCTSSIVLCTSNNPATSDPVTMTTSPSPEVSFTTCFDTVTILSGQPFMLKGGIPLGGTYSGPGINPATGVFTPSAAGTGLKPIQYTYTNASSCAATMSKTILVKPDPAFTCGNPLTDLRDNKVYPTVQIGNQCWMQANLDFGFPVSDFLQQTDNCVPEKYGEADKGQGSGFRGQISNLKSEVSNLRFEVQSGGFYQWDELMRHTPASLSSQGLCPPGWHVPSSAEWDELIASCNGPGKAGGTLKDTLLPGGFHSYQQGLLYLNNTWSFTTGFAAGSMYWTSTLAGGRAVARGINEMNLSVSLYEAARGNGFSARCLRD